MSVFLFDQDNIRTQLLPLTYTRPVGALRLGILTLAEKWTHWLGQSVSFYTVSYLQKHYPLHRPDKINLWINGAVCPNEPLVTQVNQLQEGECLVWENTIIAALLKSSSPPLEVEKKKDLKQKPVLIDRLWKLIQENESQLRLDFKLLANPSTSHPISDPNTCVYNSDQVHVADGAMVRSAIINAEGGPVYLGKNSIVREGSILFGPCALGEHSEISAGAKIRPNTSIGPHCKIGGEVIQSIITGHSNKSHDGFMGHSVLGEWCNIGAGSNTSNLKNNYTQVKLWDYLEADYKNTGLQFCGLFMGDHSKCSISTSINTGTVIGVHAMILGPGFPPKHVPSFSWGGSDSFVTHQFEKAMETAKLVMSRRQEVFKEIDRELYHHIFNITSPLRV